MLDVKHDEVRLVKFSMFILYLVITVVFPSISLEKWLQIGYFDVLFQFSNFLNYDVDIIICYLFYLVNIS